MSTTASRAGHGYDRAASRSRADRGVSHQALDALEHALAAPTPGREKAWQNDVIDALDTFIEAIGDQSRSDLGDSSLLNEIARDHPRLSGRVERLHAEHRDLRESAASLRDQIRPAEGEGLDSPDTADIRDRLASMARRYRQHRAREADLVYEAINVDLGVGD